MIEMKEWRIEAGWNISIPMDYKDYLDFHVGDVIHFEIFDNQQGKRGLLIIKEQLQFSVPSDEPTGKRHKDL